MTRARRAAAPAVLIADTGLDTLRVSSPGEHGRGPRRGVYRYRRMELGPERRSATPAHALWFVQLLSLLLRVASTPALVVVGYLLFSATFFPWGMLLVSSWADLLHVRQLAVGSAAINTLWQVGALLAPYAWGVTKDATGSVRAGLIGASVVAMAGALVAFYVRTRVVSERRERASPLEQPLAVPL